MKPQPVNFFMWLDGSIDDLILTIYNNVSDGLSKSRRRIQILN